ncbi:MAG: hypothetical protein Q4G16_06945 [Cruoricaptor ignavus]|nr:hypothetical protein [Cruoricaptor ignavus]
MKFILLTILSAIIFFFVWNILKRLFFKSFYQFPQPKTQKKEEKKNINKNFNWDAETVDYEEIKESKK